MREKLITIISAAVYEVHSIAIDANTRLLGEGTAFDSLDFVNIIVAVEQKIEAEFGKAIVIADEKAFSRSSSPFRDVGTLADFIEERLK